MKNIKISVIGLGYVGLPLAIEFGKLFNVVGYDKNKERILSLKKGIDQTGEVSRKEFKSSKYISFTNIHKIVILNLILLIYIKRESTTKDKIRLYK